MGSNEQYYYDALKVISQYRSVEWMRKNAEKNYGLPHTEALEMAYENIVETAKVVLRRKKRPKA